MLRIEGLTKYYDGIMGVENIDLHVEKGETFGLLGFKNAGKTTIIQAALSLIKKDQGVVYLDQEELKKMNRRVKDKIGYLPDQVLFDASWTVGEVFDYSKKFYDKDVTKRIDDLTERFQLNRSTSISSLSYLGMKKVGLVVALMNEAPILVLDDPFDSLDPTTKHTLFEILEEEKAKGTTIFLSLDHLSDARRVCDRIALIKDGRVMTVQKIDDLFSKDTVMITLISSEYKKIKLPIQFIKIKKRTEDTLKFLYRGSIQSFLDLVREVKIEKLLIEEPTLEEIFTPMDQ